ncbi:coiled-coil domain-containing protein 124-like [Diorhabda sublineata]|uniref:coiled-coil domain-containing protein 124-like n=1 Tax=Diorhabda sublineata TaxID=1163346 RepID=UPI0024E09C81|nr:coiled-coil domain-containing protein 124-like [Diorhabda sublineata]
MPKKFATDNTKAVVARERKKQAKDEAISKKQKEIEDAYWKDDDKQIQKKQQKKEAEEKKRQETLKKKAEAKALLEKETNEIVKKSSKPPPAVKVTRAQINARTAAVKSKTENTENKIETHLEAPLVENVNRLVIDGEEARTVDEAISLLGNKDDIDKHPEKRMKAAYLAYEEKRLRELKEENPTLRLSQLKQMIFKEWQKSPENPLNQ